jgi:GTPase SAR1 family protein
VKLSTVGNEMWEEAFDTSRFIPQDLAPYPFDVTLFRYKMCVVGDAEVGKTSLLKCFQSTPMFFKSLPTVDCTVGINNVVMPFERDGNKMQILLQDFAGQEVYHGHSAFLTPRTAYVFVWNMSNVEQTFDHYGISAREEARLKYWLDEVQSKAPNSVIAIVGTHKDVLPDQSRKAIEIILQKVHGIFSAYIDTLRSAKVSDTLFICSTFSVSCKDRSCVSENRGGPSTIKEMFEFLAEVCYKAAARDRLFPATKIPSPIIHILRALQYIREQMNVILLPVHEFQRLLWQLQVTDTTLAANMTRLLHDWGMIYVFDRQSSKLVQSDSVFLHPAALSVMCAALFSYAHACMAPDHERAMLKGLTIDVAKCDAADPQRLILKGFLSPGPLLHGRNKRSVPAVIQWARKDRGCDRCDRRSAKFSKNSRGRLGIVGTPFSP